MTPKPGDFGLTNIPGDVGKLIRFGEWLNGDGRSPYSHAFVVTDVTGDGRVQILEAELGGARIAEAGEYADAVYSSWDLTDEQRQGIVAAALELKGTPYSVLDYFAIAAHRFRLPIPGLRRYVESSRHLICSQLVDLCYQRAGVQLFDDGRWNGYVSPADLGHALTGPVHG